MKITVEKTKQDSYQGEREYLKLNLTQFNKWIKALRSGKYSQTKNSLEDSDGFCCLGVACKVLIPKYKLFIDDYGFIQGEIPENQGNSPVWLNKINDNFSIITSKSLVDLNDNKNFTFDEIADVLELVYIHKMLD